MLKRIFRKHSNVFTVSAGKADKLIKIFSLQTDGPEHKRKKSNNSFSACSFVCLFVCLHHANHDVTVTVNFYIYPLFYALGIDIFVLIPYFFDPFILYVHDIFLFLYSH